MNRVVIAVIATAAALTAVSARAGECPANQLAEGSVTSGPAMHSGATDTVIASNPLGEQFAELDGREHRLRYLTVEPGGEIAWHDHMDRPAIIYILEGEIVEHRSSCAVPIFHKTGDVTTEFGTVEHWWKNEADETVKLLSADLLRVDPVGAAQAVSN